MKKAIIVIAVLAILGAGTYLVLHKSSSNSSSTGSSSSSGKQAPSSLAPSSGQPAKSSTTITYTDNGFSPNSLTVKAGTTITIKNDSSSSMQFDSDPHPIHSDDLELNVGIVAPGESMTLTPTVTGTHGYHNHLNPSQTGTIVVN